MLSHLRCPPHPPEHPEAAAAAGNPRLAGGRHRRRLRRHRRRGGGCQRPRPALTTGLPPAGTSTWPTSPTPPPPSTSSTPRSSSAPAPRRPSARSPTGSPPRPCWCIDSYAQFASDIQSGAISPAYKWVLYDPEEWSRTPVAEQLNPSKYLTQFGQLAHAHGYKVIEAPARDLGNVARSGSACPELAGEDLDHWYIRCDIAGTAAAASDVVVVQDQVNTTNPAEYAWLFNNARQQALAANPQVIVDSELSTNYGPAVRWPPPPSRSTPMASMSRSPARPSARRTSSSS